MTEGDDPSKEGHAGEDDPGGFGPDAGGKGDLVETERILHNLAQTKTLPVENNLLQLSRAP